MYHTREEKFYVYSYIEMDLFKTCEKTDVKIYTHKINTFTEIQFIFPERAEVHASEKEFNGISIEAKLCIMPKRKQVVIIIIKKEDDHISLRSWGFSSIIEALGFVSSLVTEKVAPYCDVFEKFMRILEAYKG